MSARPLASLSSSLLARPGQAKPAMRPQPFLQQSLDDLGWNDMGQAATDPVASPPVIAPIAAPVAVPAAAPVPPVLTERAELDRKVSAPKRKTTTGTAVNKAAFTLRLDADRHLRLRLASAVTGRSAQQLVVCALDAFLIAQPDVEALARQVPTKTAHQRSGKK